MIRFPLSVNMLIVKFVLMPKPRTISRIAVIILLLMPGIRSAYSQGCSDAGFCTIGALGLGQNRDGNNTISLMLPTGRGDDGVLVISPGIQYDRSVSQVFSIQGKLTFNYASGNLASIGGLGDVYLSGIFKLNREHLLNISTTFGVKIPLDDGGINVDDGPLPMQYQSSMGTFDLLTLITFTYLEWSGSAGLQIPLSGENNNGFLQRLWTDPAALNYPNTNEFDRSSDVLIKISRNFTPSEEIYWDLGLLLIYHTADDTYSDSQLNDNPIEIIGSQGVTLNVTAGLHWNTSDKIQVGFIAGMPLVVREVRPDGLTRSWLFAPKISWLF